MMNPYQLNWPGLRDVPVVTIETETGNIYSQENLLPLKRGKLDRIEYKYVPIEAVLDEFNAEIELEEAFETLTSILEIPGVKSLYTDKSSGRKYVHVSSLLALIVVRPEDGPGFEMACNGILHFLTNHMEMACLECGYIRRDCLCQDFDICYDRSNIECVSFVKQTVDKNIQTDPPPFEGGSVENGLRPGGSTTVYLPPGANLTDCERLPDGRLNIRYVRGNKNADPKASILAHNRPMPTPSMVGSMPTQGIPSGMSPGMMLPPVSPYPFGANITSSFIPPPVCHSGMASSMLSSNPYMHLPSSTLPVGSMPSMMPGHMHMASSSPMLYQGSSPYTSVRAFHQYMPPTSSPGFQLAARPISHSTPSLGGTSLLKGSPTPPEDNSKNSAEGKRKRKTASVNNFRENQLKVKLNFKKCPPVKEDQKPLPAKRMKKTKSTSNEEENSGEKETTPQKDSDNATPEIKHSSPQKDKTPKDDKNVSDSPIKLENTSQIESDKFKNKTNIEKETCPNGLDDQTSLEENNSENDHTAMADSEESNKSKANTLDDAKPNTVSVEQESKDTKGLESKTSSPTTAKSEAGDFLPKSDITGKGWNKFEYAPTGQKIIRCLTCGQCFDKECYADKHQEMHTLNRSLSCLECDYSVNYSRWYTLLRHLYSKHQIKFVEGGNSCKLCGNIFDTVEELEDHVDAHHYNKYKCAYCGQSLLSWDAYKSHVKSCPQISQGKIYYSCPYCHFAFRDRVMKQVHVKSHQDNTLVCCYCRDSKDWENWKLLKNHYELLHLPKLKDRNPKKARACAKCMAKFKSYKGYRNHTAKCTGPKEAKESPNENPPEDKEEEQEDGKDKEEAGEGNEEKENKEEKPSEESTSKEEKVKIGKKNSKQKGAYKCDKCHKKFGASSTLDRHMVYAHGPEAKCDECDHTAKSQMLLKMHKTLKHSDKRHVCSECNRTFQYYHQYKVHLAWHARKVNYACPTCDAEFPRQMELRQHQLKDHPSTNNRTVFTCSECDFKCFSRTTLRAHLKNKHVSSDEDEEGKQAKNRSRYEREVQRTSDHDESDAASDDGEDSESGSELGEDDMKKIFSWRRPQPAPPGARRSQRTPKPSAILKDIARTRSRDAVKKKQLPNKKGRKRRNPPPGNPRIPPTSRPLQRSKGRPPKKVLKKVVNVKKIKKDKVVKKIKLRRCGCARFRTYEEFKILKKRQQANKIVERTIVEDPNTPMRRRTISQDSQGGESVSSLPKPEVPEVSWTYDTACSSPELSVEEKQRLLSVIMDHCYYQKPAPQGQTNPPHTPAAVPALSAPLEAAEEDENIVPSDDTIDKIEPETTPVKNKGAPAKRKRLSTSGSTDAPPAPAVAGQSPAKVRATVNDLESAIKFADNVTQLSKLVSILRADKEAIPSSSSSVCFFQSPPKPPKTPVTPSGSRSPLTPVSHPTPNRTYSSDYEIGELEPLPSDIMASEIESDMDLEGMMSEILEEMGQENNHSSGDGSGVSADVSQAAEVLLSLDMSGEERELAQVTAKSDENEVHEDQPIVQSLDVLPQVQPHPPPDLTYEEPEPEPQLLENCEASVHKHVIIKNIPLDNPKVAVELNDTDIQQNDFLFWAAKNDEDDQEVALRARENGMTASSDENHESNRNAWQLDHQYI